MYDKNDVEDLVNSPTAELTNKIVKALEQGKFSKGPNYPDTDFDIGAAKFVRSWSTQVYQCWAPAEKRSAFSFHRYESDIIYRALKQAQIEAYRFAFKSNVAEVSNLIDLELEGIVYYV